jgi:peptidylprolyl isomerase
MSTEANQIQMEDLVVGTGATPVKGSKVSVHYTGTLENGKKFDSSHDRRQPFSYVHEVTGLIQGWNIGVSTMKAGGKRRLIIPSSLGYGSRPVGPIPPNSTLIFEIELLSVD